MSYRSPLRIVWGLALAVVLLCTVVPVSAARGVPGTPEFGVGTNIDITRPDLAAALDILPLIRPDWLRVVVRWDAYEPAPGSSADWQTLDLVMTAAINQGAAVLISLTAAPAWSLTANGPDREAAARFAVTLANRYPGTVQAIELFPAANTAQGWQAPPNPAHYLAMIQSVQSALAGAGRQVWMVAGGLNPCSTDYDALQYLSGLYDAGGKPSLKIISLNYASVTGEPIDSPASCQNLRYYESIRQVMSSYGHTDGLLWITHLSIPAGLNRDQQKDWLARAYKQTRSQLYIGTAILQSMNDAGTGAVSLLNADGTLHPFFTTFQSFVEHNLYLSTPLKPGRAKADIFSKNHP